MGWNGWRWRGEILSELEAIYRDYIACLNARDWSALGQFVHDDAIHNTRRLGLAGYRLMLEQDVAEIPDLRFKIELLAVEAPIVAARLAFNCAPRGMFLGLPVNGRTVAFTESVFYAFRQGRIAEVWSVIDKAAIEAQL